MNESERKKLVIKVSKGEKNRKKKIILLNNGTQAYRSVFYATYFLRRRRLVLPIVDMIIL